DRLPRTPMSEHGHHAHHGLCRGAQAIEDRPSAGAEGCVALVTDVARLLPRLETKVAWPGWPLAGQGSWGQPMVVGSIMVLLALGGSMPRGVCRDPHLCYK